MNGELWHQYVPFCERSFIGKVKAHSSLKDVLNGSISFEHYFGNSVADILAGHAANLSSLPDLTLQQLSSNVSRAFCVCMRLAVVEGIHDAANLQRIDRSWVIKNISQPSLEEKVQSIQSRLRWCGHKNQLLPRGRHRCEGCGITQPARKYGYWLLQRCSASLAEGDEPVMPIPKCRDAQAAAVPVGLCWNGHRIVNSKPGFKCLLCGLERDDL